MSFRYNLKTPYFDKPFVIELINNNWFVNGKDVKSLENAFDLSQNSSSHFEDYKLGSLLEYFEPDKQFPSGYDALEIYTNKLKDPTYGSVDLRSLKLSNFSNSFANKLMESIALNADLIADCATSIAETTQNVLKCCPLFIPNKAHNLDPAKWYLYVFTKAKYISFCKTVAIDINDNYLFEALSLKNEKDRAEKLTLITEFHKAIKSGNNTRINYAVTSLKENWYGVLMPKYIDLITENAHKIYWTPIALEMLPIHYTFFGTIPVADWLFYPYYGQMRSYFSKEVPNMGVVFGPPIKILKEPPFPGKMLVEIGVFIKYNAPLFGGKITFSRNGNEY
jgi:hypothetical protein